MGESLRFACSCPVFIPIYGTGTSRDSRAAPPPKTKLLLPYTPQGGRLTGCSRAYLNLRPLFAEYRLLSIQIEPNENSPNVRDPKCSHCKDVSGTSFVTS